MVIHCHTKFIFIIIFFVINFTSCKESTKYERIDGNYYIKRTTQPNLINEPTYSILELLYKNPSNNLFVKISDRVGMLSSEFTWKVYNNNIAYTKSIDTQENYSDPLIVYLPKTARNVLIDKDLNKYWKVYANEKGIFCYPYVNDQIDEKVEPVIYSAEYISNLGESSSSSKYSNSND